MQLDGAFVMVNPTSVIRSVTTQIGERPPVMPGRTARYDPTHVDIPARRTMPAQAAYVIAALAIGFGMIASVTPTPLYHVYSELWHFSPLTLTLIYATYAFGVLAALLLAGRASDQVGRRPVLLIALGGLMAATILFIFASSTVWLFAARGLQGVATGVLLSAASAALLDLHPRRDANAVGLTNGVVSAFGLGLGVLVSSALVQLGPAPRQVPYELLFVLFALTFAGVYWMPEPVRDRSRWRLTLQRPSVPASVQQPFVVASLAVFASWSIGGLLFALGPQLASRVFQTSNTIVAGAGIFALFAAASVAQFLFNRTAPWRGICLGSVALAAGVSLIVLAAASDSSASFLAGSILAGAGFGAAFLSGLRSLAVAIPAHQRASVMSAFYIVAYASLSLPAVLAGLVDLQLGLQPTFIFFGTFVAFIALLVAYEAWRTRPIESK
jgi:MFS family permease